MILWEPIPPLAQAPGLVIYPDSEAGSSVYYYTGERPALALASEGGPDYSLSILPAAGGERKALLSATIELPVAAEALEAARAALSEPGRDVELRPLRFEPESEVQIHILDAGARDFLKSGGAAGAADSQLVLAASVSTTPGLFGTNRTVCQALLNAAGGEIVTSEIGDEADPGLPVAVYYRLVFSALRRASAVSAKVDWERVEEFLRTSFELNLPLLPSVSIDSQISKLEMEGAIRYTEDEYMVGPEADEGRKKARAEIDRLVKIVFFDRIELGDAEREDDEPVLFRFRRDARKLTDRRTYDFSFNTLETVLAVHTASGNLFGALRRFPEEGRRRIYEVPLDAPEDTRRRLAVRSLQDLGPGSELHRIDVKVEYGESAVDVTLDAEHPEQRLEWPRRPDSDRIRYSYAAWFRPAPGFPERLSSEWETLEAGEHLPLAPSGDLYELRRAVFALPADFPWDEYAGASVEAVLEGESGARQTFNLNKNRGSAEWSFPVLRGGKAALSYTVAYLDLGGNQVRSVGPESAAACAVEIPAPPATKKTARVLIEMADPDEASSVSLRLWGEDASGRASEEYAEELGPWRFADGNYFSYQMRGEDVGRSKLCASAEIEYGDGTQRLIPFAESRGLTLRMREAGPTPRLISFLAAPDLFEDAAGRSFALEFCGPAAAPARTKPLGPESPSCEFAFGYSPAAEGSWRYRWRLVVTEEDGYRNEPGWREGEAGSVTVSARAGGE